MSLSKEELYFEAMPLPRFLVCREQGQYKVKRANKLAREILNMDPDNVEATQLLCEENAGNFIEAFKQAETQKTPVEIQSVMNFEHSVRLCGFSIMPIYNQDDKLEYLDAIGQVDIKNATILQRERDDAMSLLASIFELSEVGILVTDHNTRIIRVNESFVRIYGWEKDELIGTSLETLVTPDEREAIRNNHDQSIQSGDGHNGEMKIIKKDGNIASVLYSSSTLELSQKRRFQVTTVMDISLRKQMEISLRVAKEQADNANRAKSTFLANMSHELRTPLNAIIGFSELINSEAFGPIGHEKYHEYIGDIVNSARLLLDIINEVLDMSKIESGRIELEEGPMDLNSMVRSVVRMMDSRVFASEITIEMHLEEKNKIIRADERLMRQTLINIVNNAVKFSKNGGVIDVISKLNKDGHIDLIVRDQGHGIPKEKIQHVLEPFGQVTDSFDKPNERGTGLGLPLAKAMIELHNGELLIDSDIGQGTTVKLLIPKERVID